MSCVEIVKINSPLKIRILVVMEKIMSREPPLEMRKSKFSRISMWIPKRAPNEKTIYPL